MNSSNVGIGGGGEDCVCDEGGELASAGKVPLVGVTGGEGRLAVAALVGELHWLG